MLVRVGVILGAIGVLNKLRKPNALFPMQLHFDIASTTIWKACAGEILFSLTNSLFPFIL